MSDNTGTAGSGGISNVGAAVTLVNTIGANNLGGDCSGAITSLGHNLDGDGSCGLSGPGDLSGVDPILGPLADNGGPTFTHALLPASMAIHAGDDTAAPATDQRGFPRFGPSDIGAFEVQPVSTNDIDGYSNPESTDGLGCAGCRARNGRFGGCGSGWWRWQGATVAVRACGQEETAVGRRSQACWRQAVERSARPSGVRSGAGSPAAGRGRR